MIKRLLRVIEFSPFAFSAIHRYCGGSDTNRRVFVNLLRRGDVVVEIGANVGLYTEMFCRLVGRRGCVHAFEPVSLNFDRLHARITSSGFSNAVVQQLAVGEESGRREIIMPAKDCQQASLKSHSDGSWANQSETFREVVAVTTLDEYARQAQIVRLNLLKIDVEGAELLVLNGARWVLTTFNPIVHIEINPCWLRDFGITPDDVVQRLSESGYTCCYEINPQGWKGYRQINSLRMDGLRSGKIGGDFVFSKTPVSHFEGP